MKRNILIAIMLSSIFAFSLLLDLKLAVALLIMLVYLSIIIRSVQTTLKIYFFIYMVFVGIADKSSFSVSGNQSINLLGILGLMLILIFYLKLNDFLQLEKEHWHKGLIYPIFLFSLYLILTIPLSISPTTSIRGLIRILSAFSFYLLAYFIIVSNKNAEKNIFQIITAIFIPLLIYGIIEYFTKFNLFHRRSIAIVMQEGMQVITSFDRIRTSFVGPSHYAFALLIFLPWYLFNFFVTRKASSYFYGLILFLFFINLILTFTRIAWIAIAIQGILFFFLFRPKKILRYALPLGIILLFMSKQIVTRALTIDSSVSGRFELFQYGLNTFRANPVFGSGIETFLFSYKIAAHGDYMRILAETGFLGGVGYLVLLLTNLIFAIKNFKESNIAKLSFLTIIGFMIFSFTDNALALSHTFWGVLGVYNGLIVRETIINASLRPRVVMIS